MSALLPHQLTAASWLAARDHGILGDKPGLGKTRSILEALKRRGVAVPLVVCPAFVRSHWQRESEIMDMPVKTMSYDEIVRGGMAGLARLVHKSRIDALVPDEYHYCKSTTSKRSALIFGRDGLAKRVGIVYPASGTPIHRHPGDMWPVVSALFPALALEHKLRTHADWVDRFCVTRGHFVRGQWVAKVVGMRNGDELHAILGQVMLRRDPAIERIWWQTVRVDADFDPYSDPDAVMLAHGHLVRDLADIATDPSVSRMRRRLGELKVAPVVEMIRSQLADSEERVVVFFHHRSVGHALRELLAAFGISYVDGDTSATGREAALAAFMDGGTRVFLGQQQACGTGLDGLQRVAHRIILVEPSWVANDNVQAGARLDRMGQRSNSVIGQMVCLANSLDESIVGQNKRETETVYGALGNAARVDA